MDAPATQAELDKVLRNYLRDDRLVSMPKPGRKRRILLDHVIRRFEPGVRYDEIAVNRLLRPLWDDVAAVRRYLVEAGLLDRTADGVHWRAGGAADLGSST